MLASLTISNIVLIEKLHLDFEKGLCALTGETGAGKSILLDSLGLVLGARADTGLIRQGEEQASISASFSVPEDHDVLTFLKIQELQATPELILRRSVNKDGRSRAFINDQPVSVSLLKQTGEMLVEIHGQFETQSLLNTRMHRGLLDDYGTESKILHRLADLWEDWKSKALTLEEARNQAEKTRAEEDFLRGALEDLDRLDPQAGEEEKLSQQRARLMKRDQMLEGLHEGMQGAEQGEEAFGVIWRALEKLGEEGKDLIAGVDRAAAEISEVRAQIQTLSDSLNENSLSLSEIDDRLFALKNQARKHGCAVEELASKREELAVQLDMIEHQDERLAEMMHAVEEARAAYIKQGKKLRDVRQMAAQKLDKLVAKELTPLKLDKAKFVTEVKEQEEEAWGPLGMDHVQFLVATNPGAAPGPLNKIASGGEMARFMLALKVVLAEVGLAGALVFDEVDSGIGGATAAAVGERLARLAKHRQILVVTHSPQVAAIADHHYIVRKEGAKEVLTTVFSLDGQKERTEEIARMLSAADITDEARAAAGKLMQKSAA